MFVWYLILWKQFISEIREINPTRNLRLLQYFKFSDGSMIKRASGGCEMYCHDLEVVGLNAGIVELGGGGCSPFD